MNEMITKIVNALWEELYVEGDKFAQEKDFDHLRNMNKISETIYYIEHINKGGA